MNHGAREPNIGHLSHEAAVGDADITVQLTIHGLGAIVIGFVLLLTGPTTPSFRLFEELPGWPEAAGVMQALLGSVLIFCCFRGCGRRSQQIVLGLMSVAYAVTGIVLWVTWTIWKKAGGVDPVTGGALSEPLLVGAPVMLLLAVLTAYLIGLVRTRNARGLGPTCGN